METFMKSIALIMLAFGVAAAGCARDPKDQAFVTKASQGGMAEVQLGQLAATKGVAADVKAFGQRMVSDHTRANDELKAAATAAGATVSTELSSDQRDTLAKLDKEAAGQDFDSAYAKAMVKDHKEDIELFRDEASSGQNAGLKAYAQKTLPTLEEHLRMAQALKANP